MAGDLVDTAEAAAMRSRIRTALEDSRLSMRAASIKAGLGGTWLRDYLRGDYDAIKSDTLTALAAALGKSPDWLLTGRGADNAYNVATSYEGYVLSWVEWVRNQKGLNDCYGDHETAAMIDSHLETVATLMERQLTAIQIVQTMMDEMYAANPTPRMKALRAAVEAIWMA